MKKSIKLLALLLCAVFLLANFTACGDATNKADNVNSSTGVDESTQAGSVEAPADKAAEKITLKYMNWEPANKDNEIANIIRPFEQKFPNVTIDFQPMPWDSYWKKIQVMASTDELPDVFWMSIASNWEYAYKGVIKNLSPIIENDPETKGLTNYLPKFFDQVKYPDANGDIFSMPYAWVCSLLFYNKTMFDAAGVSYPTEEWTWDDLKASAVKLTKGEGAKKQFGFLSSSVWDTMDQYISANDGYILSEDMKTSKLNEPVAVEGIQFFVDMIHKDKVSPTPADLKGMPAPFRSGKVAMQIGISASISDFREINNFDWDVAMVPKSAKTGKRVVYGGADPICISEKTKYEDMAWEFVKYYSGPGRSLESFSGGKGTPYKPIAEDPNWLEADKKPANKSLMLKSADYIRGADFGYKWSEWRASVMQAELEPAFLGTKSVQECADTATKKINDILAELN